MINKIKILYIIDNIKISSGVSSVIMNYYRKIDKERFQIDFLLMTKYKESYEKELKENGSKLYYLKNKVSIIKIMDIKKEIKEFFKNNKYDIVELHAPTFSFLFLKIAKKQNIPIRIVHSHSTIHSSNKIKNMLSIIMNVKMKKYANRFFACSQKSGEYWYGKKVCNSSNYELITNGVNIDKYNFDEKVRNKLRKKYNIEDKVVIGFVGRISKEKNIEFFIDVMKKIIEKNKKYVFLLVGDGKKIENLKRNSKKIEKNVIFLGNKNDVNIQLNCMDMLVLPSKREGLPMVAIEAQLTGLHCFLSNTITKEVNIGNIEFIELKKEKWVKKILEYKKIYKEIDREKFNINNCVEKLQNIYEKYAQIL